MNKDDVITELAQLSGGTKKDTEIFYNAFATLIENAIKAGEEIQLRDLFTIKLVRRSARNGRNPKTGQTVAIAAKIVPKVVLAGRLKKISI